MALTKPNSTTWTSETAPKGRGGSKHAKTKIKEAIGLTGWERLNDFLLKEGADKLCEDMLKLKPQQYVVAYEKLAEFVKPKLSRQTIVGENNNAIKIEVVKTYENSPNNEAN